MRKPSCLGLRRWPLAIVLAASSLQGCGRFSDYAKVVEGNRLHEKGDYQGAIVAYLSARSSVPSNVVPGGSVPGGFAPTIDYDVANVYARMGEYPAAAELYASSRRGAGRLIAAYSYFNEGSALFEQGRYEEAWKAYRSALAKLDAASSSAADARHNLELAWRAWKKNAQSPPRTLAPSSRGSPDRDESEQRLLQRLETGRWSRGSAESAPPSSSDY
jgi:tetratricopeptide (TPR) repeat protein